MNDKWCLSVTERNQIKGLWFLLCYASHFKGKANIFSSYSENLTWVISIIRQSHGSFQQILITERWKAGAVCFTNFWEPSGKENQALHGQNLQRKECLDYLKYEALLTHSNYKYFQCRLNLKSHSAFPPLCSHKTVVSSLHILPPMCFQYQLPLSHLQFRPLDGQGQALPILDFSPPNWLSNLLLHYSKYYLGFVC